MNRPRLNEPPLDEMCEKVFSVLLFSEQPLRFNELHETLIAFRVKTSVPTLIEHLHHLRKRKLLIRKRNGKQNVSYSVDWDKLETLQKSIKARQSAKNLWKNEQTFKSIPIDEQVEYVMGTITLSSLYRLKLEVQDTLDPTMNFEHSIQYLFTYRFFELFKTWLRESCLEDKIKKGQKALDMIDLLIGEIESVLFNKQQARAKTQPNLIQSHDK